MILLFALVVVALSESVWFQATTDNTISWADSDSTMNFCYKNGADWDCCNPDQAGIDDYEKGMVQAWTFEAGSATEFLWCNMESDAWLVDMEVKLGGMDLPASGEVCLSSDAARPEECGIHKAGNCVHWKSGSAEAIMYPSGTFNEIATCTPYCDVYNDPTCPNYEGGYVAGKGQTGFDSEHFQGDYSGVEEIDDIIEEMEQGFEDEAAQLELDLDTHFTAKSDAYDDVTAAELHYESMMDIRIAKQLEYNTARENEEAAHKDLEDKVKLYNAAVDAYSAFHEEYVKQIDFLNYELFIVQQIRELLGAQIGYTPTQVILDVTPYDNSFEGWTNSFPDLLDSTFDHPTQRFQRRRRKKKKRANKKRNLGKKKRRRRRKRKRV